MKKFSYLILIIAVASACRKKPNPVGNTNEGQVDISIENMAGNKPIKLDNEWYVTAAGDSIRILIFNYFISNVQLTGDDGSFYAEKESYHLITSAENSSKSFSLSNVPNGVYNKISFLIGVDSTRNVSGIQEGALDVNTGMFWDWNTGYIMAKLEAISPHSPSDSMVIYHISGFTGPYSALRTVILNLPRSITINNSSSKIEMNADVLEWFTKPTNIKIKDLHFSMAQDKNGANLADNYADMFTIQSIK